MPAYASSVWMVLKNKYTKNETTPDEIAIVLMLFPYICKINVVASLVTMEPRVKAFNRYK